MRPKANISLILIALATLVLVFQNCSEVGYRKRVLPAKEIPLAPAAVDKSVLIHSVLPNSALEGESVNLTIYGENFSQTSSVRIGGQVCSQVNVISEREIKCQLLASNEPGKVSVEVTSFDRDFARLQDAFEWRELSIAQKCASQKYRTSEVKQIAIAPQTQQCAFGQEDNLGKGGGRVSARVEQVVEVDIPEDTALCDMEFEFSDQQFVYDDSFLFALNDVILVSSYADTVKSLSPTSEGFLIYDWLDIRGLSWSGQNTPYCLGVSSGEGSCSIPVTQQRQTMSLQIAPSLISAISENRAEGEKNTFKFITTGDDNPGPDCQHSGLNFTVNVTYVQK